MSFALMTNFWADSQVQVLMRMHDQQQVIMVGLFCWSSEGPQVKPESVLKGVTSTDFTASIDTCMCQI